MIWTIFAWIYILLLAYALGVFLHSRIVKLFGVAADTDLHFSLKCITGLVAIDFMSTVLCLFIPLGLVSSLIILCLALVIYFFERENISLAFKKDRQRLKDGNWLIILIFVAFIFIIAYLSFLPSSHYDDGLYYSTSIKWLEEYGTAKGLANLNPRIGFNSSWLILQANFGFQFLKLGLFNDLNGLFLLLVFLYSLGGVNNMLKGDISLKTIVRSLFLLPALVCHFGATSDIILFNINFLGSPTPDISVCVLLWLIFLLFIEGYLSNKQVIALSDILIVIYSVWAFSIKLSAVPVFLLVLYICWKWIAGKRYRQLVFLISIGLIFILPWIVRNVLLTGYLFFPFSGIDVFNVLWKLPMQDVKWHENAVKSFAIGADINKPYTIPLTQWFPSWFVKQEFIHQVILGFDILSTFVFALIGTINLALGRISFLKNNQRIVLFILAAFAGIWFWIMKAPDFRFGYGFLCIYMVLTLALLFKSFLEERVRYIYLPIILFMIAIGFIYYKTVWISIQPFFARPIAYRVPKETKQINIPNKPTIYLVQHEDSWNCTLPVANEAEYYFIKPVFIGSTIQEGFKSNESVRP